MNGLIKLSNATLKYITGEELSLFSVQANKRIFNLTINDDCGIISLAHKIMLEIHLNKNAGNYSLIGVEFHPDNSHELKLEVHYNEKNKILYKSEISPYDNHIYCGLSEEYVEYLVNNTISIIKENNYFNPGTLSIKYAANSEVGSSPKLFAITIEIIINIMRRMETTSENINELIEQCFLKSNLFPKK